MSSTTTKLLTLSVHEALAFDGVEIAVHPDLFSSNNNGRGHARDGSFASSVSTVGHHSREQSYGSATLPTTIGLLSTPNTSLADSIDDGGSAHLHLPRPRSPPSSTTSSLPSSVTGTPNRAEPSASQFRQDPLKVGDIIEIRVWDLKPNANQSTQSSSSTVNYKSSKQQDHMLNIAASRLEQHITQPSPVIQSKHSIPPPPNLIPSEGSTASSLTSSPKINYPPILPSTVTTNSSPAKTQSMQISPPKRPSVLPPLSSRVTSSSHILPEQKYSINNTGHPTSLNAHLTSGVSNLQSKTHMNSPSHPSHLSQLQSGRPMDSIRQSGLYNSTISDSKSTTISPAVSKLNPSYDVSSMEHGVQDVQAQQLQQDQHTVQSKGSDGVIEMLSHTHNLRLKFVMKVKEKSLTALKTNARTQISLLRQVADIYNLSSFEMVTITKVDKSEEEQILKAYHADYVTLSIKDQFISRGEMYQFQQLFLGEWIYSGERLTTGDGMRGNVMQIRNQDKVTKAGFLTSETKLTFRSRSARIIWLVQISSEMWDYASPYEAGGSHDGTCQIYFDKFITFCFRLFDKWKELDVTHSLTIVFFSRTFIFDQDRGIKNLDTSGKRTILKDSEGRFYEDHYRTVVENETRPDWEQLVKKIKRTFVSYPAEVGWRVNAKSCRVPSPATGGNILEAINTALTLLQLHYMDRDLHRTGNSIVVISAGSGVFEVNKSLAEITKQRMIDNGIGSDMLSLGLPPVHVAPFFLYQTVHEENETHEGDADWKARFDVPHWMHLTFLSYDQDGAPSSQGKSFNSHENTPKVMANNFMTQGQHSRMNSVDDTKVREKQASHLISGRDFEDILEACRPRYRRRAGMPYAFISQLHFFGKVDSKSSNKSSSKEKTVQHFISNRHVGVDSAINTSIHEETLPGEWGSFNFNEWRTNLLSSSPIPSFAGRRQLVPQNEQNLDQWSSASSDRSGSSPSSFSSFSFMFGRSPLQNCTTSTNAQIQKSPDIKLIDNENGADLLLVGTRGESLPNLIFSPSIQKPTTSTSETIIPSKKNNTLSVEKIKQAMQKHDDCVFQAVKRNIPVNETKSSSNLEQSKRPQRSTESVVPNKPTTPRGTLSYLLAPKDTVNMNKIPVNSPKTNTLGLIPYTPANHLMKTGTSSQRPVFLSTVHNKGTPTSKGLLVGPNRQLKDNKHQHSALKDFSTSSRRNPLPNKNTSPSKSRKEKSKRKKSSRNQQNAAKNNSKVKSSSRKQKEKSWMNPFRQADEEELLDEKNHNSRRWSHVFPKGEIEFKRNASPNFLSLCQPAILPVTIDDFPPPSELHKRYKFYPESGVIPGSGGVSRAELQMEMVKQRLVHDFQLVPQSVLLESGYTEYRKEQPGTYTLSMGHSIQEVKIHADRVSVKQQYHEDYGGLQEQKPEDHYDYDYMLWSPITKNFSHVYQKFNMYPAKYKWSQLDNMISGNIDATDKNLDDYRFRRVSFRIIPDRITDSTGEKDYRLRFQRFLDYIEKQVEQTRLDVKHDDNYINEMKRFTVAWRKSKREGINTWMVIEMDATYSYRRAYRYRCLWLVASAIKVEAHVQLLQRRCNQFGLNLVVCPEISFSSNIFLNPLIRPETVRLKIDKLPYIESLLVSTFDFVDDGFILVHPKDVNDIFNIKLSTEKGYGGNVPMKQYIHRSGTIFIRFLQTCRDPPQMQQMSNIIQQHNYANNLSCVLLVMYENRKQISTDPAFFTKTRSLYEEILKAVQYIIDQTFNYEH